METASCKAVDLSLRALSLEPIPTAATATFPELPNRARFSGSIPMRLSPQLTRLQELATAATQRRVASSEISAATLYAAPTSFGAIFTSPRLDRHARAGPLGLRRVRGHNQQGCTIQEVMRT